MSRAIDQIVIRKGEKCYSAEFIGDHDGFREKLRSVFAIAADAPVIIPLPFTPDADCYGVQSELAKEFPGTIVRHAL